MLIEETNPALVGAVRALFAEYEIDPKLPVRKQLLKMRIADAQEYARKLDALPGSESDKDRAILAVRAAQKPLVEPLKQRTVLTNAEGQPVRITSEPGERVAVQVTDVSFIDNVLTLTAKVLEGATEVIE